MKTNTGAKWQPFGEQFAYACSVCFYRDSCGPECHKCKCEKEPGFVFDPDKFLKLCKDMTKERYYYDGKNCRPIRFDVKELDDIKKDRDFWKGMTDKSLQAIVRIAEKMAESHSK